MADRLVPGMKFYLRIPTAGSETWKVDVWTIDNYTNFELGEHTPAGNLVSQVKYGGDAQRAQRAADQVAAMLADVGRVQSQSPHTGRPSVFGIAGAVVAVPFFGDKALSLPHVLAAKAAGTLNLVDLSGLVSKTRATDPTKLEKKPVIDPSQFAANWTSKVRSVILVDDVYRSGVTLASLALVLREAGVETVAALCAARAPSGMALR